MILLAHGILVSSQTPIKHLPNNHHPNRERGKFLVLRLPSPNKEIWPQIPDSVYILTLFNATDSFVYVLLARPRPFPSGNFYLDYATFSKMAMPQPTVHAWT